MRIKALSEAPIRWLDDVRRSLPDTGVASVIVADDRGVRYIELRRDAIERTIRRFKLLALWLAVASCIAIASFVALALRLQSTESERESLSQTVATFQRLGAETLADAADAESMTPEKMSALVQRLKRRDEAFRSYVAVTARLAAVENETIGSKLRGLGAAPVELASALRKYTQTGPEQGVGASLDSEVQAELERFISAPQQDVLIANAGLRRLLGELPSVPPLADARTTSDFGLRLHPITRRLDTHQGVDYVTSADKRVRSAAAGRVVFAGWRAGYGNLVIVGHALGFETWYAHLSAIQATLGAAVQGGEVLGVMGSTGSSTGEHVHFEVRRGDRPIDPLKVFRVSQHAVQ
ncbi:hypothetical protein CKO44_14045 [Rubrivivax gelatinosus]|uniref:M23ase beta-sheet core domain-containing protein n=1 Tax=Rubrivivax gelatinosus TaxID=28068 RepID=A0ABS1DXK5_RUBGE|nr:M23 family metallopeptidase [Rubrivivax gelatinosus]MBK1614591.1 hypothetical protein [Rubrivivax gelatinosus]MBK1714819.1 hypothetical protein [Rubrivivax gelatinosus]